LEGLSVTPSDFLKGIVTSNFPEMRSLMSFVFWIVKNVVLGTEKRSAIILEEAEGPKVFQKYTNDPVHVIFTWPFLL